MFLRLTLALKLFLELKVFDQTRTITRGLSSTIYATPLVVTAIALGADYLVDLADQFANRERLALNFV